MSLDEISVPDLLSNLVVIEVLADDVTHSIVLHVSVHCPDFMESIAKPLLLIEFVFFIPTSLLSIANVLLADLGPSEENGLRLLEHVGEDVSDQILVFLLSVLDYAKVGH